MDNQRVFIWVGVALVAYMNYAAYEHDYGTPFATAPVAQTAAPAGPDSVVPAGAGSVVSGLPPRSAACAQGPLAAGCAEGGAVDPAQNSFRRRPSTKSCRSRRRLVSAEAGPALIPKQASA